MVLPMTRAFPPILGLLITLCLLWPNSVAAQNPILAPHQSIDRRILIQPKASGVRVTGADSTRKFTLFTFTLSERMEVRLANTGIRVTGTDAARTLSLTEPHGGQSAGQPASRIRVSGADAARQMDIGAPASLVSKESSLRPTIRVSGADGYRKLPLQALEE